MNNTVSFTTVGAFALGALVGAPLISYFINRKSSKTGKPRLTYFAGRGLAEVPRLILAEAGQEYDDVRVQDIEPLKKDGALAFGQVPLLEWGNLKLAQSGAISRYLAREFGLYGANSEESARCDMIFDGVADIRQRGQVVRNAPQEKKAEVKAEFESTVLPQWIGYFEALLAKNNSGQGFFVGSSFTFADLAVFNFFSQVTKDYPGCLDNSHLLMSFLSRVAGRPRIAKWLRDRPVTEW